MYSHDVPVHVCRGSACAGTEHLPPAPHRPVSADEGAALLAPTLGTLPLAALSLCSLTSRQHLRPADTPLLRVLTWLFPARGSSSFSAMASRALPPSLVPISRLSHAGEKGDGFPFADRMPFLYFLTPDTSDKSSISTSETLTHLKVLAPVPNLLLKVTH